MNVQRGTIYSWEQEPIRDTIGIGIVLKQYKNNLQSRLYQVPITCDLEHFTMCPENIIETLSHLTHHAKGFKMNCIHFVGRVVNLDSTVLLDMVPVYSAIVRNGVLVFDRIDREGPEWSRPDVVEVPWNVALAGDLEHIAGYGMGPMLYSVDVKFGGQLIRKLRWSSRIAQSLSSTSRPYRESKAWEDLNQHIEDTISECEAAGIDPSEPILQPIKKYLDAKRENRLPTTTTEDILAKYNEYLADQNSATPSSSSVPILTHDLTNNNS